MKRCLLVLGVSGLVFAAVVRGWAPPATAHPQLLPATTRPGSDLASLGSLQSAQDQVDPQAKAGLGADPVLVGAGDITSCGGSGDEATARLLAHIAGTVFTTGDNAYDNGTYAQYIQCYKPSWGRFKARTRPAVGNHEYHTAGAAGYYRYFGRAAGAAGKGYYSYNRGKWHIVVINSNCGDVGGCGVGSPQERWLRRDLAAHPTTCTLAYWHHPRFSSGPHGSDARMQPVWQDLYRAGADVVVNGHDHEYERFAPQNPSGTAAPKYGIREFVIGTGGRSHYAISSVIANSRVHNDATFGVLKLTLHGRSYTWRFIPVAGGTFIDSGTSFCHARPPRAQTSAVDSRDEADAGGNPNGSVASKAQIGNGGSDENHHVLEGKYETDGDKVGDGEHEGDNEGVDDGDHDDHNEGVADQKRAQDGHGHDGASDSDDDD